MKYPWLASHQPVAKLEHSFLAGARNLDGRPVPQFLTNSAAAHLTAIPGRVHHLASMRPPDSEDSLVWDLLLEVAE